MQSEIALEIRMDDGIMVSCVRVCRMDGFHASIETQDEIIEIQSESQAVGHGNLTPKAFQAKLPAGLFRIVADSPYVACIQEYRPVEFPK